MSLLLVYAVLIIAYFYTRIGYWNFKGYKSDVCTDGYFTLMVRDQMRASSKFRRISYVEKIAVNTPMFYPPIPMFFGAVLPGKIIRKYFGLINSTIDLLLFAIVLAVSNYFNLSIAGTIAMGCAFIFLPCTFGLNVTSNIHFNLSWRDLGKFTSSLYFLMYFLCIVTDAPERYLFVSLCVFSLINLYSSLFAQQAIVFGSIILSLLRVDPLPFGAILVSNLFVLIIDTKWVVKYYRIRYTHFKSYFVAMRKSHPGTSGSFSFKFSHLKDVVVYFFSFNWKDLKSILKSDPVLRGIYLFPTQVPVSILLMLQNDRTSEVLFSWHMTAVILWILTSNKLLKIFGEPDRYLEFFGHLPIYLGIGFLLNKFSGESIEFWLIITSVFVLPLYIRRLLFNILKSSAFYIYSSITKKQGYQRPGIKTVEKLEFKGLRGKVALPITFSNAWKVAYKFDCSVLFPPMFTDPEKTKFICDYPYPNWENIDDTIREYQIDYFVVHKTSLSDQLVDQISEYSSFEKEIEEYSLYRIEKTAQK